MVDTQFLCKFSLSLSGVWNEGEEDFVDSEAEEGEGSSDESGSTEEEEEPMDESYSEENMRKRIRKLDEDEEEAGDSPMKGPPRSKRARRILSSSDEEDDVEVAAAAAAASSSSSGDDVKSASEACTICLHKFSEQEVGLPSSCSHVFCADCIIEWTNNVPTCPIDRRNVR